MSDGTTTDEHDGVPNERTPLNSDRSNVDNDGNVDDDDDDTGVEYDTFYNDPIEDMTNIRRVARYLSRFHWYYPRQSQQQREEQDEYVCDRRTYPKLDVAWAHLEHVALPRCLKPTQPDANNENGDTALFTRAEPGEIDKPTMLYPVWGTHLRDMGDFGVGIGIYFFMLKFFAIVTFLAGILNLPAIFYLRSDAYSKGDGDGGGSNGGGGLLDLSMVCLSRKWHPCPDCLTPDDYAGGSMFAFTDSLPRYARGEDLTFIEVSECEIDDVFGFFTYISLLFVVAAVYYGNHLIRKKTGTFDEAVQTTTDYSIKIVNPPPDAKDPSTWKTFFESRFPNLTVNLCTTVLANTPLLKALVRRRTLLTKLQNSLPPDVPFRLGEKPNDLDEIVRRCRIVPRWKRTILRTKTPAQILVEIRKLEGRIAAFATEEDDKDGDGNGVFDVTGVFVTFDSEASQRKVLEKLVHPRLREEEVGEEFRFGGKVLRVIEPDEPDSIRWTDLDDTLMQKTIQQTSTLLAYILLFVLGAYAISQAQLKGSKTVSLVIVAFNLLAPRFVRLLTSFESHRNESLRTASQYVKITLFRWSITVFIPFFITPFVTTVDGDALIENVKVLLVAEMMQRPILQWVSLGGLIKRHVLGPRAEDQRRMNVFFSGDPVHIAERYTDITKILLLTLFYCILYPVSFFFASFIFSIYYWVDKFLILRKWKQGPMIGTAVSHISSFFFKLCLLAYALGAAYVYSQFPYDNACPVENYDPADDSLPPGYEGNVTVTTEDGTVETLTDVGSLRPYRYCNQELFMDKRFPPLSWRAVRDMTWMDGSQKTYAYLFAWTSLVVAVLVVVTFLYRVYMAFVHPLFFRFYKPPSGKAMDQKFRDVKEISAYVPQIRVSGYAFPFLLCDTKHIDDGYVGWNDPHHGLEKHNLVNDFERILAGMDEGWKVDDSDDRPLFSIVREWE